LTICAGCVQDIQRRVNELPHLALALRSFLGGSVKLTYESKVNASHAPECPMDVRVADLLIEIDDALAGTNGVAIKDLITHPAVEREVWIKNKMTKRFLDGVDRAMHVRRVHERVGAMVGLGPLWQRRHAPCPTCGLPSLGSWGGADWIECLECETRISLDEYDAWCIANG